MTTQLLTRPALRKTAPARLTVGVIGSAHSGLGLARLFAEAGHRVLLGHCKGASRLTPVLADAHWPHESVAPEELAKQADVIILGAASRHLEAYLGKLGPLAGKTVLDPSTSPELQAVVAQALPQAHVVRAFQTVHWTFEAQPLFRAPWERETVEFAGDDAEAKATVARLIASLGLVPHDLGALENARHARGLVHLPAHSA